MAMHGSGACLIVEHEIIVLDLFSGPCVVGGCVGAPSGAPLASRGFSS